MKISKLFHWLYAILMLLPFAFFVPSVLYYAFNDNATMQSVEVPKTETISVDFNQIIPNGDFSTSTGWVNRNNANFVGSIDDNSYILTGRNDTYTVLNTQCGIQRDFVLDWSHIYLASVKLQSYVPNTKVCIDALGQVGVEVADGTLQKLQLRGVPTSNRIYAYLREEFVNRESVCIRIKDYCLFDLTKMFGSGNEPSIAKFNELFPLDYYSYTESELMQITYDTGETEQLVENTSIINYAWESIWNLPLFSWCKVSFVATPFTYITGLFGLSASNSFNYVFTYFASMSIIWLVFDVIMYVPLLVHRWLDKGIVE